MLIIKYIIAHSFSLVYINFNLIVIKYYALKHYIKLICRYTECSVPKSAC